MGFQYNCFFVCQLAALFFSPRCKVPSLPPRWALVLGSEHYGVRPAVREVCRMRLKVGGPSIGGVGWGAEWMNDTMNRSRIYQVN